MDLDDELEMAEDFAAWVKTVTRGMAAEALGVSKSTISLQLRKARAGNTLTHRTAQKFRERWELSRELAVALDDPCLDEPGTRVAPEADEKTVQMTGPATPIVRDEVTDSGDGEDDKEIDLDVPPWTGTEFFIPGVVPEASPAEDEQEDHVFGKEMADIVRQLRRYRAQLEYLLPGGPRLGFLRTPGVEFKSIEARELELRVIATEVDLISTHEATLPPHQVPYTEMQKMDELEARESRRQDLAEALPIVRMNYHFSIGAIAFFIWVLIIIGLLQVLVMLNNGAPGP